MRKTCNDVGHVYMYNLFFLHKMALKGILAYTAGMALYI
jgi:hypothetical protein